MAGNANDTHLWLDADVFIAPIGTAAPTDTTTAWAAAWKLVGLLDGDEGFAESRDQDTAEFYAWGGKLIKRSISKQKRTIKFVALENNDTVFDLVNPGSTRTTAASTRTAAVKVPTVKKFAIGFEQREGTSILRRIAANAQVAEVGEIKFGESNVTAYEITVILFPDSTTNVLYTDIETLPA